MSFGVNCWAHMVTWTFLCFTYLQLIMYLRISNVVAVQCIHQCILCIKATPNWLVFFLQILQLQFCTDNKNSKTNLAASFLPHIFLHMESKFYLLPTSYVFNVNNASYNTSSSSSIVIKIRIGKKSKEHKIWFGVAWWCFEC